MKTIENIDVKNKRVIVREDLNVTVTDSKIENTAILKEAAKNINYLRNQGAKVIVISDFGNPEGHIRHNLRMENLAPELEKVLNTHVEDLGDIVSDTVFETVKTMEAGEVVLLENLGFYEEEYFNDEFFARALARLGEIYVDDDFRIADKEYASNVGITQFLPSYAGLSMKNELDKMTNFLQNIDNPFTMLIGGTEPENKMAIIERFLPVADFILVAGEIGLAFLKAQGHSIGQYTISDTAIAMAKQILCEVENEKCQLITPVDFMIADQITPHAKRQEVHMDKIPDGWFAVDIGPRTFEEFNTRIYDSRVVLWNGPVGVYEYPEFEYGTRSIAQSIASTDAKTIVGGTDTVNAINKYRKAEYIDIVSYGGGSFLSYLKAQHMPGLKALSDK